MPRIETPESLIAPGVRDLLQKRPQAEIAQEVKVTYARLMDRMIVPSPEVLNTLQDNIDRLSLTGPHADLVMDVTRFIKAVLAAPKENKKPEVYGPHPQPKAA